jgi:hypothetical protein
VNPHTFRARNCAILFAALGALAFGEAARLPYASAAIGCARSVSPSPAATNEGAEEWQRWVTSLRDALLSGSGVVLPAPGSGTVVLAASDGSGSARLSKAVPLADAARAVDGLRAGARARWFGVHVIAEPWSSSNLDRGGFLTADPTLHALRFSIGPDTVLPPEVQLARGIVTGAMPKATVDGAAFGRYLASVGPLPEGWAAFESASSRGIGQAAVRSWFADERGIHSLLRSHRRDAGDHDYHRPIELAASYLLRSIDGSGRFAYEFEGAKNGANDAYNILRHAGTLYAMLEIDEAFDRPALGQAIERGIDWLRQHCLPCPKDQAAQRCVVEGRDTKLGGNALTIVALAKHAKMHDRWENLDLMRALARRIVAVQDPGTGEFREHKATFPDGTATKFTSGYYPGECIFALTRLYEIDPNPQWLDAARLGVRYLIDVRDRGKSTESLTHDHWLLYGIDNLHRLRPERALVEHGLRIAQAIVGAQTVKTPEHAPDFEGSFRAAPETTPTAIRVEGLMAAHRMFARVGERGAAERARAAANLGLRFVRANQITEERAMYFPDPHRVLGGFLESFGEYSIRIDYVQHAVSALLATWQSDLAATQAPR